MKINRNALIKELRGFVLRGNGVVIGPPGVGKTYSLIQLHNQLRSSGISAVFLPIDQLGLGTDAELRSLLSYEGDLVEKIATELENREFGIVIFDAFDAARNEEARSRFVHLIRRIIIELRDKCHVLVTVRTYDAQRSQDLLRLFASPLAEDPIRYISEGIPCRHFSIPLLSEDEIVDGLDQIGLSRHIFEHTREEFKSILRYPFNLWLLDSIVKTSGQIPDLSQVVSEVQLLNLFWGVRIRQKPDSESREFLLSRLTGQMVRDRSLTVRKDRIFDPKLESAYLELLSDEILTSSNGKSQRLRYSHNTLFDYSVSNLLIEEDPDSLNRYISKDKARPFFLLPSFLYHFTSLWYEDRDTFWRNFWALRMGKTTHVRLFSRLVPTRVVINEARNLSELDPLINPKSKTAIHADQAILHVLQALRSVSFNRLDVWIGFLNELAKSPKRLHFWDLATLNRMMLDRSNQLEDKHLIRTTGSIARILVNSVLDLRKDNPDQWLDTVTANQLIPVVAKTYCTDISKSKKTLSRIFGLLSEDQFPIQYLQRLTDNIDSIWPCDPEFVSSIYEVVFSYREESEEKTQFGGTIISFTSTRRQDFEMCNYQLVMKYDDYLKAEPRHALRAAVRSLNGFIIGRHVLPYIRESQIQEGLGEVFNFGGIEATYIQDNSYIWYQGSYHDEPIKMADFLFSYLGQLVESREFSSLDLMIEELAANAKAAFFWKRLLVLGIQYPSIFAHRLFDLCIAFPILIRPETTYEIGQFINAASEFLSVDDLLQIEKMLVDLPSYAKDARQQEGYVSVRNRLLTTIPTDLISTPDAKDILHALEASDSTPINRPLVSMSKTWSKAVTDRDWLEDKGVDVERADNRRLMNSFPVFDNFNAEWRNDKPSQQAVERIIPFVRDLLMKLDDPRSADRDVLYTAWTKISEVASNLAKSAQDPSSDPFKLSKKILLTGIKRAHSQENQISDDQFNFPSWSPSPKNEAAQGLPWLVVWSPDPEIVRAIRELSRDALPSARFLTAMELWRIYWNAEKDFWEILEWLVNEEGNRVVLQAVCRTLGRILPEDQEYGARFLRKLAEKAFPMSEESEFGSCVVSLVMSLSIIREDLWAHEFSNRFFNQSNLYPSALSYAIIYCLSLISPGKIANSRTRVIGDRAMEWLLRSIDAAYSGISKLQSLASEIPNEKEISKVQDLFRTIDRIVLDFYFKLDIDRDSKRSDEIELSSEERADFFLYIKAPLESIIHPSYDVAFGLLPATTAHHIMKMLKSILPYQPREVLRIAADVVKASESTGYSWDSLAIGDIVDLVESILANYRYEVRDEESLSRLIELLDTFVDVGWPEALDLVWRLDEIFR
jgi:hypothetical protein